MVWENHHAENIAYRLVAHFGDGVLYAKEAQSKPAKVRDSLYS